MKCLNDSGACLLDPRCEHACGLRVNPVFQAGRADCTKDLAAHMGGMVKAIAKADTAQLLPVAWIDHKSLHALAEPGRRDANPSVVTTLFRHRGISQRTPLYAESWPNGEVVLRLSDAEAREVHQALYLRLRALSMVEDNSQDACRRAEAVRIGEVVASAADKLKPLLRKAV